MVRMTHVLKAWGKSGFSEVLVDELGRLNEDELPLQAGLAAGSYSLARPLEIMVIGTDEKTDTIEAKVGIFYRSLIPGCACEGDPTVEDEQNEYCIVRVTIDKQSAETAFTLVEE